MLTDSMMFSSAVRPAKAEHCIFRVQVVRFDCRADRGKRIKPAKKFARFSLMRMGTGNRTFIPVPAEANLEMGIRFIRIIFTSIMEAENSLLLPMHSLK